MLIFLCGPSDSAGDFRRRRSRFGNRVSEGIVEIKVWDSAGDLRRRRSGLGRVASEGTVEIKVLFFGVGC